MHCLLKQVCRSALKNDCSDKRKREKSGKHLLSSLKSLLLYLIKMTPCLFAYPCRSVYFYFYFSRFSCKNDGVIHIRGSYRRVVYRKRSSNLLHTMSQSNSTNSITVKRKKETQFCSSKLIYNHNVNNHFLA